MKKIIFSVLSAFCMLSASAQSEFCMMPVHADSEDEAALCFYMDTDFYIQGMQFNVLLPKGVTITTNKSGKIKEGISYDFEGAAAAADWTPVVESKMVGDQQQVNFAIGATGGSKIPAGKGHVFTIYTDTDEMEAGVYPVEINVKKFSNGVDKAVIAEYTSYIVIDEGKGVFVAKNVLGNVVNEFLVTDANVTGLDLSAVTAVNGEFAYTVGKAVTAPAITADVKVVAGLNGGQYGSLCSPVALPGVKCYKFTTAADGIATFTEVDDVPANEVVIIDAAVEATVTGATLASVANGTADAGRLYVAPDGSELRRAKNSVTVPALRGTWDIAGGSNLRIALDTPTGIKMIGTANEVFGNTYDLQGRQVENAQNGVYVVNGKKQFVK